jgi:DNA-binding CsgD family transcriptional regulator
MSTVLAHITISNRPFISPVVVGREREAATLHSLIDLARQGRGHVLLLSGEAGIGKSRLLAEGKKLASEQGFHILQGACFPTDRSTPYAPLLDLLFSPYAQRTQDRLSLSTANPDPLVRELGRFFPGLLDGNPGESPLRDVEPEQEKRRLFVALSHFLTGLAAKQPLLLAVEDLHWSDESSLDFLHYLARRCAHHPLLLVLTYRNDEIHPPLRHWLAQLDHERLAQEIVLNPLSRDDVKVMLQAILGGEQAVPDPTLDTLYALTEGNPFFLEEILKSLSLAEITIPADEMEAHRPSEHLQIPRSVLDAVHTRLEQLSPAARHALMLAAVAGRRFDFALLQRITQQPEEALLALIKELIQAQLVVEESEEQFAFRHALTRQAIYTQLLLRERKALHRTIAETSEDLFSAVLDAHLAELAYHYYEGDVWEKALLYARRAGERSLAMHAPRAAVEQFTRALKATHALQAAPLAELYRLRGQAYETLGEFEHARSDYLRALNAAHEANQGEMQWQAVIALGFLWAERDYERSGSYFRQALQLAQQLGDKMLQAHSLNRLGNWFVNTGQIAEGLAAHQQALDVFQRQQDQAGVAQTHDLLGMTLAWSGDFVKGVQHHAQAIALFRALGDHRGLISTLPNFSISTSPANAETVFVASRQADEAEGDALEAVRLARQMDWPAGEAYADLAAGTLLASFGQFGRGLALAQQGLQMAMEIEHQQWIVAGRCHLGFIHVLMLEPAMALHHLHLGLSLAEQLGSAWWLDSICAHEALAYLLEGRRKQAERSLQTRMARTSLMQEPRTLTERRLLWVWGELALANGESQLALQIAEQLIASAPGELRTQPIPRLLKLKGEALIALKRPQEAVEALQEARRGAQERRDAPLLWQVHASLGSLYRLLKPSTLWLQEARNALKAAREGVEALAQTIEDAELREHFLQRALASLPKEKPLSPKRATAAKYGGLTARERSVAALIAQGKSNREIADALVVSERTVESHIANILHKLTFSSRTQVAAWAVKVGLHQE